MTIDYDISHEQARAALHTGRRYLNGGAGKQLDAHLAACAACRAYADHLAEAEPALAAALHAQWDTAQPPLPERAFTDRVRARAARPRWSAPSWLSAAPLTAGVALLVLVAVWISSEWGSQGVGPVDAPQPTEVVIETSPLYEVTAMARPDVLDIGLSGTILFSGWEGPSDSIVWDIYSLPAAREGPLTNLTSASDLPSFGGTWSPDGEWIAFVTLESNGGDVYVMRADGSDLRRLTLPDGTWQYLRPLSWSPDGQTLAVARAPASAGSNVQALSSEGEVVLFATDGTGSRVLGPGLSPKWSPDGARIAFLRALTGQTRLALFTVRADGTDEGQVSGPEQLIPNDSPFDWSPDSAQLAYVSIDQGVGDTVDVSVYLAAPDGRNAQRITALNTTRGGSSHVRWSPTGAYLLFDASLRITEGTAHQQSALYLFNFATHQTMQVLLNVDGDFSWSPDGKRFVAGDTDLHTLYEFILLPAGMPMLVNTVPVPGVQVVNPQWRPDPAVLAVALAMPNLPADMLTRWVAYLVRDAQNHDAVYVMRTDGSGEGQYLLDETGTPYRGHDLAWSPDGTRLAFVSNSSGRPQIYVSEAATWTVTPLTAGATEPIVVGYNVAWSPDGRWLAVTAWRSMADPLSNTGSLYLLDPEVSNQSFPGDATLVASDLSYPALWSPDGAWLAYGTRDANGVLALVAIGVSAVVSGANPQADLPIRQLTKFPPLADGSHDVYLGFAWSPDSRQMAYLRQGPWVGAVLSATRGAGFNASIEAVSFDDPDARPMTVLDLTPSPNGITGISWSPDGAYLLYLSDAVTGGTASTGCWTPRLVPAAGGAAIQLEGICALTRSTLPQWIADGRYLLLITNWGLAVIDVPAALADPAHVTPIFLPVTVPGLVHSPTWQPRP